MWSHKHTTNTFHAPTHKWNLALMHLKKNEECIETSCWLLIYVWSICLDTRGGKQRGSSESLNLHIVMMCILNIVEMVMSCELHTIFFCFCRLLLSSCMVFVPILEGKTKRCPKALIYHDDEYITHYRMISQLVLLFLQVAIEGWHALSFFFFIIWNYNIYIYTPLLEDLHLILLLSPTMFFFVIKFC